MTIRVRQWKKGKRVGFEVDIGFTYPDGAPFRQRIKAPVESKSRLLNSREPSPAFGEMLETARAAE
jgi:hypothetical protein